jgi:hypothetical protein
MAPIIPRSTGLLTALGIALLGIVQLIFQPGIGLVEDVQERATSDLESVYHHGGNQQDNHKELEEAASVDLQNEDRATDLTKTDQAVGLNPLHFCRSNENGNFVIPGKHRGLPTLPIWYQCTGPAYKKFGQKLSSFADNITFHGPTWGRRPFPIPANKRVLALGNSHTRQVMHSLICHTGAHVETVLAHKKYVHQTFRIRFLNGATLYLITNSPVVYSQEWVQLVEKSIHIRLDSLDAIILGQFNGQVDGQSKFFQEMQAASENNTDIEFDLVDPPDLALVTKLYQGPILFLGSFYQFEPRMQEKEQAQQVISDLVQEGRNNLIFIDSRKYVQMLENNECSSNEKYNGGTCEQHPNSHRCTGQLGGHCDLVAFDLEEALHSIGNHPK